MSRRDYEDTDHRRELGDKSGVTFTWRDIPRRKASILVYFFFPFLVG